MELLKITYDRDPNADGEASKERLEKVHEILNSNGQLTIQDEYNYTYNTDLNTYMVVQYVRQFLEVNCSFIVVGESDSNEFFSGSYIK